MIAINFSNPDKTKVARNIIVHLNYTLKNLLEWILEEEVKESKDTVIVK